MDASDYEDEGFIINEIEVTAKKSTFEMKFELETGLGLIESKKPSDFHSYEIKQESPIVTDAPVQQYVPEPEQQFRSKRTSISKPKEKRNTLYSKYFKSGQFTLSYSRFPLESLIDPLEMQTNFAANYIQLGKVFDYNPNDYTTLKTPQANRTELTELTFDSNFESGNLLFAFQDVDNQNQYHLVLHNDTNSRGYTQWFYFSIKGHLNKSYKFRIVNLIKRTSMFAEGMKPWLLSKSKTEPYSWRCFGQNIMYEKTRLLREADDSKSYYQMSFDANFQNCQGQVYIAMCPPYSYSKMVNTITCLKEEVMKSEQIQMQVEVAAHSISSNCVPIVIIKKKGQSQNSHKPLIGFSARQHPGQTWSSYLVEGILRFLVGGSPQSKQLLNRFDFVIFPMINVDGVIYGNFRCDINGNDMNRRWRNPHKVLQKSIIQIRRKLTYLHNQQGFQFFFDLHGHSKKLNTFCYSCIKDQITCRIFPLILQKLDPGFFFPQCTFNLDQSKLTTARAVIFQLMRKETVMTIECSFFGTNKCGQLVGFSSEYMFNFASNILKALNIYYGEQAASVTRTKIEEYAKRELSLLQSYQKNHAVDSGSDSDPSEFELTTEQRTHNVLPKRQAVHGRKVSKIKPPKLKTNQALSQKSNNAKIREDSKELPEQVVRRPRRETEYKTKQEETQPKEEYSPRRYNRKVVSQIKQIKEKIIEAPLQPVRNCETEQSVVKCSPPKQTPQQPSQPFKSFASEILVREESKQVASSNLVPRAEKPLYHITREYQRMNPVDKKTKFIRSINDSSLHSIDNFDTKFSDYLLRKNHQQQNSFKAKSTILNKQSESTRQINSQSRQATQLYDNGKPLALVSKKLRQELETRRKRNVTSRSGRHVLPAMSSNKTNPVAAESVKLVVTNKGKKDTGLEQFSKIWKINMKRYGKDIE